MPARQLNRPCYLGDFSGKTLSKFNGSGFHHVSTCYQSMDTKMKTILLYFRRDKNAKTIFCPCSEAIGIIVALVHPDRAAYRGRPLVPHTIGDL